MLLPPHFSTKSFSFNAPKPKPTTNMLQSQIRQSSGLKTITTWIHIYALTAGIFILAKRLQYKEPLTLKLFFYIFSLCLSNEFKLNFVFKSWKLINQKQYFKTKSFLFCVHIESLEIFAENWEQSSKTQLDHPIHLSYLILVIFQLMLANTI